MSTNDNDSQVSRRNALSGALLPATMLLLGGCMGGRREEKAHAQLEVPARRGGSARRPDGTRVFRNHALVDQDGRTVRFQEDLVEARVFAATFQYAKCNGICRNMTEKMTAAADLLDSAMGHPIQFYMFSLAEDSPADMKAYMEERGIYGRPGWRFLSGPRAAITDIRWAFGFGEPDEDLDQNLAAHTGMVRYCHHATDKWAACPALSDPRSIALLMLRCFPCDQRPRVPALEPHFAEGGKPIPGYKPVVPAMPVEEA
jgi:protein SCO1/2